ncbi:MAG: hypothetical protein Ct9H90mP14_0840 [Methanobacteriota archaeon]|nr:MAG: hypothetical protein Ct9H90mP14_0840 [Euryarchaeota archaeon]
MGSLQLRFVLCRNDGAFLIRQPVVTPAMLGAMARTRSKETQQVEAVGA